MSPLDNCSHDHQNDKLQEYINKQQEKTNTELWETINKIREKTDRIPFIETKLTEVLEARKESSKRRYDFIKSVVMISFGVIASALYNIFTGSK